jgi:hypothetical protein
MARMVGSEGKRRSSCRIVTSSIFACARLSAQGLSPGPGPGQRSPVILLDKQVRPVQLRPRNETTGAPSFARFAKGGYHESQRDVPIGLQSTQVESCGIPPFAKGAKDPDFLPRGFGHGHVCGFLQGKPHKAPRNPLRSTGNPGPGAPVVSLRGRIGDKPVRRSGRGPVLTFGRGVPGSAADRTHCAICRSPPPNLWHARAGPATPQSPPARSK